MKTLKNFPDSILFHMGMFNKALFNKANKIIAQNGFPIQVEQLPVVMVLYYEGDQSQQEIAVSCDRDKSSIQRSISSLLKREIVQVAQDPHDKRKNIVHLTAKGKSLAKEIEQEIFKIEHIIFGNLSQEKKASFIKHLEEMHKLLEDS